MHFAYPCSNLKSTQTGMGWKQTEAEHHAISPSLHNLLCSDANNEELPMEKHNKGR